MATTPANLDSTTVPNTTLTNAEINALVAVANGNVVRVYRSDRNILRGPSGVSSATLWRLDAKKLIVDGNSIWGELNRTCRQVLTEAGRAELSLAKVD